MGCKNISSRYISPSGSKEGENEMRWIIKIILFPISLSSKLLKAKEQMKGQMKGQDKSQEIDKLKSEIEEREKDLLFADSWEQSVQIRADIDRMKAK